MKASMSSFKKTAISEETIKDYLMELFQDRYKGKYNLLEYPKHYVWEEDGNVYSMWTIAPGISTGDGGIKLYAEALQNLAKNG